MAPGAEACRSYLQCARRMAVEKRQKGMGGEGRKRRVQTSVGRRRIEASRGSGKAGLGDFGYGYFWKEKTGWCEWGREGPGARAGDGRWAMGGFSVARMWVLGVLACWSWIALMAPELCSVLVCFVVCGFTREASTFRLTVYARSRGNGHNGYMSSQRPLPLYTIPQGACRSSTLSILRPDTLCPVSTAMNIARYEAVR
jgi:hypothetical protein